MTIRTAFCAASVLALATATGAFADSHTTTLTIATVNNGDMVRMQGLTDDFTAKNPDIALEWVTLEENVLRQRVTQDIATKGGQFDVMTIGTYEVPIWGAQNWLVSLNDLPAEWDVDDILPAMRGGLTVDGELYAAPFYGESSMVMYRKDLMEAAGMEMPDAPTWDDIRAAAEAMTDKDAEVYGICLRGKAGWGENMAFLTAMANSYGARWFDEEWKPQFDTDAWKATLTDYLDLMNNYGPPGASTNGFNENLSLFQQGKCGMWIDATVAASFVTNPDDSTVADKVGFALAPDKGLGKRGNWLWAWSLAIPAGSDKVDAAKKFVAWATSKEYTALVAANEGWANVPPGTRTSLYENEEYTSAAPFAEMTLESINAADPTNPTVDPVPYTGVQFVAIPEFAGIATQVGQEFSAALAGQQTAEEALEKAQALTTDEIEAAGY
ncbi:sugar ABC transporter substrate-binding protein [Sulfitobacter pseudonitzschiae]|uniref:Sugar ABC transporter substrate-binding protein n=1 Tax=Pseudosulfitobacter pseudonitzschiae TaxID=1402135 RepID=A0A9Q2P0P6_9RHOB|nr:sugar ABC transporter substrate-binding protein [Pseudosulfitobacter pseudonitzschiae]MBM2292260.1 sugar ABC transporter substrate-binding protein [Pseudosulfitobacter pseudonitzschiae]MBM2297178.1 sugar ABC transporter substrate-binding protein [Pseudosulfitobacter pseudonitzschiae]MBM2302092.1 sugar ABC transporter substrate-binding protein [Pseudosulfitobacter pseudonitzschiae]MBM2311874.1 sugar ABC transporter substrate-binding protein [Pseudosulfitobacter pseudonitzschiae]MBM2316788.1 